MVATPFSKINLKINNLAENVEENRSSMDTNSEIESHKKLTKTKMKWKKMQ